MCFRTGPRSVLGGENLGWIKAQGWLPGGRISLIDSRCPPTLLCARMYISVCNINLLPRLFLVLVFFSPLLFFFFLNVSRLGLLLAPLVDLPANHTDWLAPWTLPC